MEEQKIFVLIGKEKMSVDIKANLYIIIIINVKKERKLLWLCAVDMFLTLTNTEKMLLLNAQWLTKKIKVIFNLLKDKFV